MGLRECPHYRQTETTSVTLAFDTSDDAENISISECIRSQGPSINLYIAETNGGTLYLTDTNMAASLVNRLKLATISTNSSYTFPSGFFDGSNKYFMFEGASAGHGKLVLDVWRGANKIAETAAWVDLHDVKDLYEQTHITGVATNFPQMVEQSATSGFKVDYSTPAQISDETNAIGFRSWLAAYALGLPQLLPRRCSKGSIGRVSPVVLFLRSGPHRPLIRWDQCLIS